MFLFSCVFVVQKQTHEQKKKRKKQTLDNKHNSQQQHYNLFPSLDQNRHTRRGGAKQGEQFGFPFEHTTVDLSDRDSLQRRVC